MTDALRAGAALLARLTQPRAAASCVAVLALVATVARAWGSHGFCLDDAWIHLSYAKSLRLGEGFSYNPGDHETGFSSPLWVALIALLPWANDPVLAVKLAGAVLHAALALGALRLTAQLVAATPDDAEHPSAGHLELRPLLAGCVVALDPALTFSAVSGMEVSLTAALLVWGLDSALRGARVRAFLLSWASVWARPESMFLWLAWSGLRAARRRDLRELVPLFGAFGALAVWVAYCAAVSGYAWPNTYYAKRGADPVQGLLYVGVQVLPEQAWLLSLTGLFLLVRSLRASDRAGAESRQLFVAWLVTTLAIAVSRRLFLGPLFFNSRYFAIAYALPWIVVACGLPMRGWSRVWLAVPIALAGAWLGVRSYALQYSQESDITTQHVEPARWLAARLRPDSRLAVEGAGAMRFFLPRTVRVLDVEGLNDKRVVHAATPAEAMCEVLRAHPTHVALPDEKIQGFQQTLRLVLVRTFVDPANTTAALVAPRTLYIARVLSPSPLGRRLCAL